ncbi:hypothetical protein ACKP2L_05155 [Oenococcus alcoholitolerans]|uniref:hypothetical protein n=1 Tax=Oenococcus alcoholitolerans TaxID=931074 RepID=UPI003F720510
MTNKKERWEKIVRLANILANLPSGSKIEDVNNFCLAHGLEKDYHEITYWFSNEGKEAIKEAASIKAVDHRNYLNDPFKRQRFIGLWKSGKMIKEISEELSLSRNTVTRFVDELGLPKHANQINRKKRSKQQMAHTKDFLETDLKKRGVIR